MQLSIANSLWPRIGLTFNSSFLDRNRRFFGSEVTPIDMTDPASVGIINDWVSDETQGMIPEVLDYIPDSTVLYLINAMHFHGTWTYQFDPDDTRDMQFHRGDGGEVTVPVMVLNEDPYQGSVYELPYLRTDDFQAVSLPYGDDGRFSMCLFQPAWGRRSRISTPS